MEEKWKGKDGLHTVGSMGWCSNAVLDLEARLKALEAESAQRRAAEDAKKK